MWQKGKETLEAGWLIYDMEDYRPYIFVSWPNRKIANIERKDLLRPYNNSNKWRKRLKIVDAVQVESVRILEEFLKKVC